jgi:hypothetical protein
MRAEGGGMKVRVRSTEWGGGRGSRAERGATTGEVTCREHFAVVQEQLRVFVDRMEPSP